jgi:hypothetical protein
VQRGEFALKIHPRHPRVVSQVLLARPRLLYGRRNPAYAIPSLSFRVKLCPIDERFQG